MQGPNKVEIEKLSSFLQPKMINPTVFWSQTDYILKIRIQVENPFKPPIISFDEKHLKLIPEAFNIEEVDTLFKLPFYDSVVPDVSGLQKISRFFWLILA